MSFVDVTRQVLGQTQSTPSSLNSPIEEGFTSIHISSLEQPEEDANIPLFGTQEEEEKDARLWDAQFAATPDDKLNKLVDIVQAKIRAGKTSPMDFTDK